MAKFQIEAGNGVAGQYTNGGTTAGTDLLKLRANSATQRLILEGVGGTVQTFLEAGGSIGLFGTVTNHDFRIRTNYVDRMTFDTAGNVGTTTPGIRLTVVGSGSYSIDAGNFRVGNVASPVSNLDAANKSYVDSVLAAATSTLTLWGGTVGGNVWNLNSGNVGIGTTNPNSYRLMSISLFLRVLRCFTSRVCHAICAPYSSNRGVTPFGYLRIKACFLLPEAFRR